MTIGLTPELKKIRDDRRAAQGLPPVDPTSPSSQTSPGDALAGGFSNTPYANTPAFQEIIKGFSSDSKRTLPNQQAVQNWQNVFKGYADTFASQFKNLAGRDPTADEYNTFFQQVVLPRQQWNENATTSQLQADKDVIDQKTKGVLADTFSSQIADAQQKKAQSQADAATASGSPFDQWQQSYMKTINDTEGSLRDYQARLFEKLRPNLLTSLQAQGLLNTGALNEAFAGAAEDLGSTASNYVAGARGQAAKDIANRKFAIQSAPTNFALTNTFNTIPNLTASGQGALQNAFNYDTTMNLNDINFQREKDFYNSQQPNPLSQYAGLILGGAASGFGNKVGSRIG